MKKFDAQSLLKDGSEITIRVCEIYYEGDEGNRYVMYSPFFRVEEDCRSIEDFCENMSIDVSVDMLNESITNIVAEWRDTAIREAGCISALYNTKRLRSMTHYEAVLKVVDEGEDGVSFDIVSSREQKGPFDAARKEGR